MRRRLETLILWAFGIPLVIGGLACAWILAAFMVMGVIAGIEELFFITILP